MRRAVALALAGALAACSGGGGRAPTAAPTTASTTTTSSSSTTVTTTSTMPPPSTVEVTTTSAAPAFHSSIDTVTAADLGASWHAGCPVAPGELRMVTVTLVGFDGVDQTGQVVVAARVAKAVVEVFRQLYTARFPVRKMKPIFTQAEFDDFETPDDNSTGFSCRDAVNDSSSASWSQHAFGEAVDINPIENPYIENGRVIPSAGAAYTDRTDVRPGMATPGSVIVKAFRSVGWGWGASFSDYQHFSTNGR